jgi:hypothetical protein
VDAERACVEVWRPEDAQPEVVTEALPWRVAPGASELVIDLAALFRDPRG